jgi:hypothetical protein
MTVRIGGYKIKTSIISISAYTIFFYILSSDIPLNTSIPTERTNRWGPSPACTILGWLHVPPPPSLSQHRRLSHSVTLALDGIGSHGYVTVPEASAPSAPWLGSTTYSSPMSSASPSLCSGSRPSCCSHRGVVPPSSPIPTSSSLNNFVHRPHSSGHGQSSDGQIRASFGWIFWFPRV